MLTFCLNKGSRQCLQTQISAKIKNNCTVALAYYSQDNIDIKLKFKYIETLDAVFPKDLSYRLRRDHNSCRCVRNGTGIYTRLVWMQWVGVCPTLGLQGALDSPKTIVEGSDTVTGFIPDWVGMG